MPLELLEERRLERQPVLTIADRATDTYTRQQPRAARLYATVRF